MDKSSTASNPTMSSKNNPKPTSSQEVSGGQESHPQPSDDIGWTWGFAPNWSSGDKMSTICNLCGHPSKGGVTRLKHHIAKIGVQVKKCPKATPEQVKAAREALEKAKEKKSLKVQVQLESRQEVRISKERLEEDEGIALVNSKRPREFGPMDRFASLQPQEFKEAKGKLKEAFVSEAERKKRRDATHEYVASWVYEANIPFHAVTLPAFDRMCEAIGQFGPGYAGPSMYQLGTPLLRKALAKTEESLETQKLLWENYGCSLMTDSWTDRRCRSVMNMCVHCSGYVSFYKSKEDSLLSHTGQYIFEWVDDCIEEIGSKNIVQIVTDNASANMAAKDLMKAKRPEIFWTSCAAHTVDLMLKDIGKLDKFEKTIKKARDITTFIYSHGRTLALMRNSTKDIVRPGITRFATSFLTLSSLLEKKEKLIAMFGSPEFSEFKFHGTAKRKCEVAHATVISPTFWNNVKFCLKVFTPIFRFLRMVDSDKNPSMGFIVGELLVVKKSIKEVYKNVEKDYKPVITIMDNKALGRLDSNIHLATWFLNPLFYFAKDGVVKNSGAAKLAVLECAESFFPDLDIQDTIQSVEMLKYMSGDGAIGKPMAMRGSKLIEQTRNPAHWWNIHGGEIPYLQSMAMKLLSLTGSSSGCERNWSTFEGIHTKKRNRLDSKRLSDLVFVQFNLRMKTRMTTTRKDGKERDILLARDGRNAAAWVIEEYPDDDDEVEFYPGTDIPMDVIADAAGANEILQPRRSKRNTKGKASTSTANFEEMEMGSDVEISDSDDDALFDDSGSDDDALRDELLLLGMDDDE